MCLFIYFIVYWGYSKFVYEFVFIMYLVMDHMSWICYDFEHSSGIMSVTGRIINSCYIIEFCLFNLIHLFIFIIIIITYIYILFVFSPEVIVFIYLFVHILEKWRDR